MKQSRKQELERISAEIRLNGLKAIYSIRNGHVGGSMSIAEILAVLYFDQMQVYPDDPKNSNRDRFVLSKGHCTPTGYATLSMKGFISFDELWTFRRIDSRLSGHMCMEVPGVDASTGSLGQGLSVATGMALSAKCYHRSYKTYALCGDGEMQEGQIWEALMAASNFKLDNLCLVIDYNKIQLDDRIEYISPTLFPINDKLTSFGWNVIEIDGHDVVAIHDAVETFKKTSNEKPTAIIANTIKGKGVSIFEDKIKWHGSVPSEEEFSIAFAELEEQIKRLEA